ncbi:hypothetical protein EIP91_003115 [Steccherinum ochraceum]|uniref:RING-type domain-containing protein n=1 Tax=Steccherinum ochraceum TaxID=92696 RepID=A0A4R0RWT1_9APHY|nr:hypothetical protein EIP91_003115 [Steccherinum ochraceum]
MVDEMGVSRSGDGGALRRKKKSSTALSQHSSNARPLRDSVASDEVQVGKPKRQHRPQSQVSEDLEVHHAGESRSVNKLRRRESSRSRETSRRATPRTDASGDEADDVDTIMHTPGEYARMKRELDELKRSMYQTEKRTRKQDKELEKLRKELSNSQKTSSEQSLQITKLKSQSKKADELITTIENHMNCHICMDILARPYGLSPCGHVLCMGCLQEWFRTAAPSEDDMDDDDMPDSLVYRKKTCPVCRTVVHSRPIPLFVVKSIASSLEKHKAGSSGAVARRASPPPEADPWAGIFLDPSAEEDLEDEDGDVDEEEDGYDEWESSDGEGYGDGYGTGYDDSEEDDDYQGAWVHPHWEPPSGEVSPQDYAYLGDVEGEELSMIRRGCSLQMINLFQMRYHHDSGLQALVDGNNIVYLGWNVHLLDHDVSGEEYMDWVTRDIHERPERWDRDDSDDGSWSAWKLIREDEDQEYDTTDSEVWFDGQGGEDELD